MCCKIAQPDSKIASHRNRTITQVARQQRFVAIEYDVTRLRFAFCKTHERRFDRAVLLADAQLQHGNAIAAMCGKKASKSLLLAAETRRVCKATRVIHGDIECGTASRTARNELGRNGERNAS